MIRPKATAARMTIPNARALGAGTGSTGRGLALARVWDGIATAGIDCTSGRSISRAGNSGTSVAAGSVAYAERKSVGEIARIGMATGLAMSVEAGTAIPAWADAQTATAVIAALIDSFKN